MAKKTSKLKSGKTRHQFDAWVRQPDGTWKRPRKTFSTVREGEAWVARTKTAANNGDWTDPTTIWTFKAAADAFFAARQDRRAQTISNLRSHLEAYLTPRLGNLRLDRITVRSIENLRTLLRDEDKLKRSSRQVILGTCSGVFKYAMHEGRCKVNPVALIEREHTGAQELSLDGCIDGEGAPVPLDAVPSPDEMPIVLERAEAGLVRTALSFAAATGMREGEILAIQWPHLVFGEDGADGLIHVERTLSWARGKEATQRARFYPPKTPTSLRTIPLPAPLATILKRWTPQAPSSPMGLVFPDANGLPMRPDRLRDGLARALSAAGFDHLRHVNFHGLRHYHASVLIEKGAQAPEVQVLLGHKNPGITLSTYIHFFRKRDAGKASDAVTRAAASLFRPSRHKIDTAAA